MPASKRPVRQLLLGRGFYRKHFGAGAESPVLWLPDVFGYAWNLPQLIKEAGLEYFFTIKIGWNQYNRLPYDSFWWQGLDGTRVLTHFSTTHDPAKPYAATYNAKATPAEAISTWTNFQQKEQQTELLMSYGWGNGAAGLASNSPLTATPTLLENDGLRVELAVLAAQVTGSSTPLAGPTTDLTDGQ